MASLMIGIIWTLISGFMFVMMYYSGATITVNGEEVSQAEFNAMLWPKLFIGVFLLIGIVLIVVGLRKLIRDGMTATKGTMAYGIVIKISETGTRVNNRPLLKADVAVIMEDRTVEVFSEEIGYDYYKYRIGEVLQVKYYNKDINIIGSALEDQIPGHIMEKVFETRQRYGCFGMPYNGGGFMQNPYGMNGGYANNGMNNQYGMNGGYANNGMNNQYGMNGGYGNNGMNNQYGMNGGYGNNSMNNQYGMNGGYGNNGMNNQYGMNGGYSNNDMNDPYGSNNDVNNGLDDSGRFKDASGSDIYGDTYKEDYYKF